MFSTIPTLALCFSSLHRPEARPKYRKELLFSQDSLPIGDATRRRPRTPSSSACAEGTTAARTIPPASPTPCPTSTASATLRTARAGHTRRPGWSVRAMGGGGERGRCRRDGRWADCCRVVSQDRKSELGSLKSACVRAVGSSSSPRTTHTSRRRPVCAGAGPRETHTVRLVPPSELDLAADIHRDADPHGWFLFFAKGDPRFEAPSRAAEPARVPAS